MSDAGPVHPFPFPPARRGRTPFSRAGGERRSRSGAVRGPAGAPDATGPMHGVRPDAVPPMLDADDPRWVLALRVREAMQGPLLPPASRSRLDRLGRVLGLTPFEVNLVIAIVQDQRRRGGGLDDAAPSLAMVPRYHRRGRSPSINRWHVAAWLAALLTTELGLILLLL